MAERDGYRAKSSRAIALKSKWEQMCQRLVRMGAVCRMWRGAYVVSLPDMVAVVMRVMGRCEEVRSGRAESCCEVVYSQSVSSQSLGERSGLASRGRNEGGSWLPRKGAKPKKESQPNSTAATKAASSSRHRARAHPSTERAKPSCRPTTISPPHVNNWLASQPRLPNASSPSSSIFEDLPYVFPQ